MWNAQLRRMPGLGPEGCREPVQQGRDVVGVQCMKFAVVQLEPVGWRRAGGSKQVSRKLAITVGEQRQTNPEDEEAELTRCQLVGQVV